MGKFLIVVEAVWQREMRGKDRPHLLPAGVTCHLMPQQTSNHIFTDSVKNRFFRGNADNIQVVTDMEQATGILCNLPKTVMYT